MAPSKDTLFAPALRELKQWILSDKDGIPNYPSVSDVPTRRASPTDYKTWTSLEYACGCLDNQYSVAGLSGDPPKLCYLGFVLTPVDPFVVIDLDAEVKINGKKQPITPEQANRHAKIKDYLRDVAWWQYTSAGGKGTHIWLYIGSNQKQKLIDTYGPAGRKRDAVEVYWAKHYMRVPLWATKSPINVASEKHILKTYSLLEDLCREMYPVGLSLDQDIILPPESPFTEWDMVEVIETATTLSDKTLPLMSGDWHDQYPSQSEADYALFNILCAVAPSYEMAKQIFWLSELGQRPKAKRIDYLRRMVYQIETEKQDSERILANFHSSIPPQLPPPYPAPTVANGHDKESPFESNPSQTFIAQTEETEKDWNTPTNYEISLKESEGFTLTPPGFISELTGYFFKNSARPVKEVALFSAIGLLSGICNRAWNISETGLNLYLMLIARTGVGKEQVSKNIDKTLHQLAIDVPAAQQIIGPGTFASAPGVHRVLTEQPGFLSVLGEFGLTLQALCSPRANSTEIQIKKLLLLLYGKSGHGDMLTATAYSDAQKNLPTVFAPSVTLVGESTPDNFYTGLEDTHIAEGLIPRFVILEYTGKRSVLNESDREPLTAHIKKKLTDLISIAFTLNNKNHVINIQMTEEAKEISRQIDCAITKFMNSARDPTISEIWNRVHLNTLRLAGIVAVVRQEHTPVVNKDDIVWAFEFIKKCAYTVIHRFEFNMHGKSSALQGESMVCELIHNYPNVPRSQRINYKCPEILVGIELVPYYYIYDRLKRRTLFKNSHRSMASIIRELLNEMVNAGIILEINRNVVKQKYGMATPVYGPGPAFPKMKGLKKEVINEE